MGFLLLLMLLLLHLSLLAGTITSILTDMSLDIDMAEFAGFATPAFCPAEVPAGFRLFLDPAQPSVKFANADFVFLLTGSPCVFGPVTACEGRREGFPESMVLQDGAVLNVPVKLLFDVHASRLPVVLRCALVDELDVGDLTESRQKLPDL